MAHYSNKLKYFFCDHDTFETKHINNFELYVWNLEKLEGSYTEEEKT